jgi:hypothetical protein
MKDCVMVQSSDFQLWLMVLLILIVVCGNNYKLGKLLKWREK